MKYIIICCLCFSSMFSSAQKIGINTPTPAMQLEVKSPDSASLLLTNSQVLADSEKTALYFRSGSLYTGAIKTHVEYAAGSEARMGFFTFGLPNANGLLERMSIRDNGNVGIGTVNPSAKFEVAGSVKIADGTQGAGKLLTSDAAGNASWQTAASSNAFRAYAGTATLIPSASGTTYTQVTFDNMVYNQNPPGVFTGNTFHAPTAGVYHFDISLLWNTGTPGPNPFNLSMVLINTGFSLLARSDTPVPGSYYSTVSSNLSCDIYLAANEAIYVGAQQASGATIPVVATTFTSFDGHRVF